MVTFDEVAKTDFKPMPEKVELIPASYIKNNTGIYRIYIKENKKGEIEKDIVPLLI